MDAFLAGDAPGPKSDHPAVDWHAEAVRLQQRIDALALDALVIPQSVGKKPCVRFTGPKATAEWKRNGALSASVWNARARGLGMLLYKGAIALDFDKMHTPEGQQNFERCLPHLENAPREVTGDGVHVFFQSTEYSRQLLPAKRRIATVDCITVTGTGTGHNVNVAPSGNKRWVARASIFDLEPPPIPNALVDQLVSMRMVVKTPSDTPPAVKKTRVEACDRWYQHVERDLLTAVGLDYSYLEEHPIDNGSCVWYMRTGCRCPFGCNPSQDGAPVHDSCFWSLAFYKDTFTISYNGRKHKGLFLFPTLSRDLYDAIQVLKPFHLPEIGLNAICINPPHSAGHLPCTTLEYLGAIDDNTWCFLTKEACARCDEVHYDSHHYHARKRSVYKLRRSLNSVHIHYPCRIHMPVDHGVLVNKPFPAELPQEGQIDEWLLQHTGKAQPSALDGAYTLNGKTVRIKYRTNHGHTYHKSYEFTA